MADTADLRRKLKCEKHFTTNLVTIKCMTFGAFQAFVENITNIYTSSTFTSVQRTFVCLNPRCVADTACLNPRCRLCYTSAVSPLLYFRGVASVILPRCRLCYTSAVSPLLYFRGVASVILPRCRLCYTFAVSPLLYFRGVASVIQYTSTISTYTVRLCNIIGICDRD